MLVSLGARLGQSVQWPVLRSVTSAATEDTADGDNDDNKEAQKSAQPNQEDVKKSPVKVS